MRKNYARIGMVYDKMLDAFIQPQPYPSWNLDQSTGFHIPPIAYPQDGLMYAWDENIGTWVAI